MIANKLIRAAITAAALTIYISSHAITPAEHWADSVMNGMNLEQRVAQLFCPRLDVRDNTAGREAIRRMVEREHVGGILLGKGNIVEYAKLNNYAQSLANVPLMITLDGEWGPAMRLT
ncbi:MAG: hypothetical protein K2O88_00555, partial [Paramuribaculum sp.]|nr:hypothetical protein [Paramuribaculum sp.]